MMYGLATTLRFRMIRNINKNRNFWRKWHKAGREDIFDFATNVFEMQMGVQMKMPRKLMEMLGVTLFVKKRLERERICGLP